MLARKATVFSFFSGIGLLDLGFEKAGFRIAFVNEYHPSFLTAYQYARESLALNEPIYEPEPESAEVYLNRKASLMAERVDKARAEGPVGFIGGPPCPDFSIGGKNRGLEGDNGKLSQLYLDLISEFKPDFFLFENVKGLWKTRKHKLFFDQLCFQARQSHYDVGYRIVNSIEYGVPQDRERIMLIGLRKEFRRSVDLDEWSQGGWRPHTVELAEKILRGDIPWPKRDEFGEDSRAKSQCPRGIPELLTVEGWFRRNDVYNHANAGKQFKPRDGLKRMLTVEEGDDSRKSFKRLHRWRYAPTAAYGNNEVHLHPYKARRISVAEALAIQSMPRGFVMPNSGMTLSDMFKAVGNGVPFLLSEGIALTIADLLGVTSCGSQPWTCAMQSDNSPEIAPTTTSTHGPEPR